MILSLQDGSEPMQQCPVALPQQMDRIRIFDSKKLKEL